MIEYLLSLAIGWTLFIPVYLYYNALERKKMSVKTIVNCDVCEKEMCSIYATEKENITVIFTTEQIEGRNTGRYLYNQSLDICHHCKQKMIQGKMLFAAGAMGHNKYWFNE